MVYNLSNEFNFPRFFRRYSEFVTPIFLYPEIYRAVNISLQKRYLQIINRDDVTNLYFDLNRNVK